jgi:hypothetical protein
MESKYEAAFGMDGQRLENADAYEACSGRDSPVQGKRIPGYRGIDSCANLEREVNS